MHSAALRGDRLALCHTSLDVHRLALSRPPSPSPQLLPVTDGGAPARPIEKTNPNPRLRMSSALPATAPPLDDEDFLREILLRLPPNPSSLPRASVVCKRWRSILSDAKFLRRFRKHHRKPPLLGFFPSSVVRKHVFTPVLESPDRIPATRFSVLLSRGYSDEWDFHGCRHGLCVLTNKSRRELVVPWYNVLALMMGLCGGYTQTSACLYESACGVWGDVVSMATTSREPWGGRLAGRRHAINNWYFRLLRTENHCLGLAYLSGTSIHSWEMKSNCDGVTRSNMSLKEMRYVTMSFIPTEISTPQPQEGDLGANGWIG